MEKFKTGLENLHSEMASDFVILAPNLIAITVTVPSPCFLIKLLVRIVITFSGWGRFHQAGPRHELPLP